MLISFILLAALAGPSDGHADAREDMLCAALLDEGAISTAPFLRAHVRAARAPLARAVRSRRESAGFFARARAALGRLRPALWAREASWPLSLVDDAAAVRECAVRARFWKVQRDLWLTPDRQVASRQIIVGRDAIAEHLRTVLVNADRLQAEYDRAPAGAGYGPLRSPGAIFLDLVTATSHALMTGLAGAAGGAALRAGTPAIGLALLVFAARWAPVVPAKLYAVYVDVRERVVARQSHAPPPDPDLRGRIEALRATLARDDVDAFAYEGATVPLAVTFDDMPTNSLVRSVVPAEHVRRRALAAKGDGPRWATRRLEVDWLLRWDERSNDFALIEFVREPQYIRESKIWDFLRF